MENTLRFLQITLSFSKYTEWYSLLYTLTSNIYIHMHALAFVVLINLFIDQVLQHPPPTTISLTIATRRGFFRAHFFCILKHLSLCLILRHKFKFFSFNITVLYYTIFWSIIFDSTTISDLMQMKVRSSGHGKCQNNCDAIYFYTGKLTPYSDEGSEQ